MEFGSNKKIGSRRVKVDERSKASASIYPHPLQLYTVPPVENISLQEFEDFAIERLKVLKAIETVGIRHIKGSNEYREGLTKEFLQLRKQNVLRGISKRYLGSENASPDDQEDRRKDHISHFILRLAYCKTEEYRRWFISQEMDLFRYRFLQEDDASIQHFLDVNNLDYTPIDKEEQNEILQDLIDASPQNVSSHTVDSASYYKVPFVEALDLVRNRRVYLKDGYAYVPQSDLVVIILTVFRSQLSHALAMTSRAVPNLEEDHRLLPMLKNLSSRYLGQDYSKQKPTATGEVTPENLDKLSKKYFPLCMQQVHGAVRREHHLRHWGRQQYGLFLKGIGLSMEDALRFWRSEFTKMVDSDKFDKQYSYNIRHNYGKEGKRADYTPYSCIKIITTNSPAIGDQHGCPFKHTDSDLLKQRLEASGVPKPTCDEILDYTKRGHYQLACGRYYNHQHNQEQDYSPNHPNQYFEEGYKLANTKPDAATAKQQTPARAVRIVPASQQSQATPSQTQPPQQPQFDDEFDDDIPMDAMDEVMQSIEQTA